MLPPKIVRSVVENCTFFSKRQNKMPRQTRSSLSSTSVTYDDSIIDDDNDNDEDRGGDDHENHFDADSDDDFKPSLVKTKKMKRKSTPFLTKRTTTKSSSTKKRKSAPDLQKDIDDILTGSKHRRFAAMALNGGGGGGGGGVKQKSASSTAASSSATTEMTNTNNNSSNSDNNNNVINNNSNNIGNKPNKSPKKMITAELQRELRRRGLNATGEKKILVKRLEKALNGSYVGNNDIGEPSPFIDSYDTKRDSGARKRKRVKNEQKSNSSNSHSSSNNSGNNSQVAEQLASVLIQVQNTVAHEKYIGELESLLTGNKKAFVGAFQAHVDRLLADAAGGDELQRLHSFIVAFATRAKVTRRNGQTNRFGLFLLPHFLQRADAAEKNVRERATRLIASIIDALVAAGDYRDRALFEDVLDVMIRRSEDRVATVRAGAVRSLRCLQAIGGEPVARVMREAAQDLSPQVRLAAVESVHLDSRGVELCIGRVRDIDIDVRKATVSRLVRSGDKKLRGEQRRQVIAGVLAERDTVWRADALALLREEWFDREASGSATSLLRMLDATSGGVRGAASRVSARFLGELLRLPDVSLDPQFDIATRISAERALLWQVYAKECGADDPFMPEVSRFVDLLRQYQTEPFIAYQLLLLCRHLDMADEVGRRLLVELLRSMLCNEQVSLELLEPTMLVLRDAVQRRDDYIRLVVESIAEMREPLDFGSPKARRRSLTRRKLLVAQPPIIDGGAGGTKKNNKTPAVDDIDTTIAAARGALSPGRGRAKRGWLVGSLDSPTQSVNNDNNTENNNDDDASLTNSLSSSMTSVNAAVVYPPRVTELRKKLEALQKRMKQLATSERFQSAAACKMKIERTREEMNALIASADEAARKRVAEKRAAIESRHMIREAHVLGRCLRLAESLLAMCGTAKRDAQLDGLLDSVILPAVRHAAPHVRAPAVRALGLFCLQGWPEAARQYVPLLLHALQKDSRRIQRAALRIVFDMLHMYGVVTLFGDAEEQQQQQQQTLQSPMSSLSRKSLNKKQNELPFLACVDENGERIRADFVLARLLAFLEDQRASLAAVAIEGFAKLLFNGALRREESTARQSFMLLVAHFLADKSGDNGADDDETFSSDDGDGNATTQVDVDFDDIDDDCVVEGAVERCSPRARAKQLLVVFFGAAATNAQLRALSSWALIPVMRRVQYWRRRSSPFAHISSPLLAGRLLTSLHAQSPEHLTSARVLLAEALSCPAGAERNYIRLLKELPIQEDDSPAELQRIRALVDLALMEFQEKTLQQVLKAFHRSIEKQLAKASNEFREELRDAELELLHRQLNKYRKEQAARVVTLSRVGIVV